MIGLNFELFLSFGFGIIISAIAFFWTQKSLSKNQEEAIYQKEENKSKKIATKQPQKLKVIKKEVKQKVTTKSEQKPISTVTVESIGKSENVVKKSSEYEPVREKNTSESNVEWKKVKTVKKTKKEVLPEVENLQVNDEVKENIKVDSVKENIKVNSVKENIKVDSVKEDSTKKSETKQIAKETVQEVVKKVKEKPVEQEKNIKSKKLVTVEEAKVKNEKELSVVVNDLSPKVETAEEEKLKAMVSEMTTELDKMKNNQKDIKTNSQNNKEIDALKVKLTNTQKNEEKLLEDLKKKGQAVTDLKNQFLIVQSELTRNIVSNQSLTRDKLNMESRLRSLEDQSLAMDEKCKLYEQLKAEHQLLENNFSSIENELQRVKQESMDILRSREVELSMQANLLQSEKQRLQEQLLRVQTDYIDNTDKIQIYQQDLLSEKKINADLLTENLRLQQLCAEHKQSDLLLQQQLSTDFEKSREYEEQIVLLKNQINDINSKNADLSHQKSALQNEINLLKNVQAMENNSQINELTSNLQMLKQQIEGIEEKMLTDQIELEDSKSLNAKQRIEIAGLMEEKENLVSLVDQYKTGLESTELILSKLQMSVNEEETKWRESLTKSENEAEKSKKELESVYNDLMRIRNSRTEKNELNFAYHCVDKSLSSLMDEMEARMIHFEKNLETLVQERDNALAQVSSQLNGVSDQQENSHSKSDAENVKNDMEVNKTLENQSNKHRDITENGLEKQSIVNKAEETPMSVEFTSSDYSNNGETTLSVQSS